MAEITDPRRPMARPGTFARILTASAQCLKWLFLSLVFSIVIEWIGMLLWWEEQGVGHSRQMLIAELSYLDVDFRRSVLTPDPLQFAKDLAGRAYHVLFELTRLVDLIEWAFREGQIDGQKADLACLLVASLSRKAGTFAGTNSN